MKEKSCGAIVFKKENTEFKFLLVHQSNGHHSFPKGHMEENETEIETALREIKEETNLDVDIDSNFRVSISYLMESKGVMKESVYFVATPTTFDLINQEGEITECSWNSYDEAIQKIEFDDTKEILKKAYDYIKNNN